VKKDEFFCEGCHRYRKKVKGFWTLGPVKYLSPGTLGSTTTRLR